MSIQLPGAILEPGLLWAGLAGYSTCEMDVWHYTVGRNSIALCRDRGLVQTLTRDEGTYQFVGSLDMTAWTQCEFNSRATANEVESLDGSVSDAQLALMSYREVFVLATLGIPQVYYDGPRMEPGVPYRGVTCHRNLVHHACDMHSDGWDRSMWDAVMGGAQPEPTPTTQEGEMRLFRNRDTDTWYLWDGYNWTTPVPPEVVWDLAVGGVPSSAVGGATMHWLMVTVGENVEAQVQRIGAAAKT